MDEEGKKRSHIDVFPFHFGCHLRCKLLDMDWREMGINVVVYFDCMYTTLKSIMKLSHTHKKHHPSLVIDTWGRTLSTAV